MADLTKYRCAGCHGGEPGLSKKQIQGHLADVPDWRLKNREGIPRLERVFTFPDFRSALAFAGRVGEVADAEGHHPVLQVEWGRVTVTWWTHATGGLHLNDFIMAAKTDAQAAGAAPAESPSRE
jgi:4a-hydroxytetrahydrobiopterin dehydratase